MVLVWVYCLETENIERHCCLLVDLISSLQIVDARTVDSWDDHLVDGGFNFCMFSILSTYFGSDYKLL